MDKWFQRDWVLRVISLALAFILWFMVSEPAIPFAIDRSSTTVKGIQVEYRYDARKYQLMNAKHKVDLMFIGDKDTINQLPSYHVFVDLKKLPAGKHSRVPIQVEGLPAGVQVNSKPSTIPVEIAEKIVKNIPITIITRGTVAYGYELLPITYTPKNVRVSGIKQEVEKITNFTATVYVNGRKQTVNQVVKLTIHSKTAQKPNVKWTPATTRLTIPIQVKNSEPNQSDQAFRDIALKITVSKPPPAGYKVESITATPAKVRVYGSKDQLNSFSTYPGVSVDLSQITEDTTMTSNVKVVSPAVKVAPTEVEIYVKMIRTPATG